MQHEQQYTVQVVDLALLVAFVAAGSSLQGRVSC